MMGLRFFTYRPVVPTAFIAMLVGLLTAIGILFPNAAEASHVSGGDISYECLGNNQFRVQLNIFKDCAGVALGNSETIDIQSTCGANLQVTVNLIGTSGTELSQLCSNFLPLSTCSGGTYPGMEIYTYEAIVTLPYCNGEYTFSWGLCCRNAAIVNINNPGGTGLYVETTMNMANDPCNNSAVFTNSPSSYPLRYTCVGANFSYNFGVTDPDIDSLEYTLISAYDVANTPVAYAGAYTATQPMTGISLNSLTGDLSVVPNAIGNFIVTVLVEEFDANGLSVGTITRDIQIVVEACGNQNIPELTAAGIFNTTGVGTVTGPTSVTMCRGDFYCFHIAIEDSDFAGPLIVSSNIAQVFPTATWVETGGNPDTIKVCLAATPGVPAFGAFTITASDDACPVPGVSTFTIDITIEDAVVASSDLTICNGDTGFVDVTGGNTFQWSTISGDPINNGVNFACDTCDNAWAFPTQTTEYLVTSDLVSTTCPDRDTVVIHVPQDIDLMQTQTADTVCLNQSVQFDVTPSLPGTYVYDWAPDPQLQSYTASNPTANMVVSGRNWFYVTVSNSGGCVTNDSVSVYVSPTLIPDLDFSGDTVICGGEDAQIAVDFSTPPACGYTLQLFDDFDGAWGTQAQVNVLVDGVSIGTYTNPDTTSEFSFPIPEGADIELVYTPEPFNNFNSYILLDPLGNQLFSSGQGPTAGSSFLGTADCGGYTYAWTPAADLNDPTIPDPIASPEQTTLYTVTVMSDVAGCSRTETFELEARESPTFQGIDTENEECLTGNNGSITVAVNGGTGPYQYSIDGGVTYQTGTTFTGLTAGNYQIIALDDLGCMRNSGNVTILPYVPITAVAGTAEPICYGESVGLSAIAYGGLGQQNGFTYTWTPAAGLSDPNVADPVASPANTTTYTLVVDDGCGDGTATDMVDVVVVPFPDASFVSDGTTGCVPHEATFTQDIVVPNTTCVWHIGTEDPIFGCGTATVTFDQPGIWGVTLTVTTDEGCTTTISDNNAVTVYPSPVADFEATPKEITIADPTLNFEDLSTGSIMNRWWNFAGLDSTQEAHPTYTFPSQIGYYDVTLTVQSADGCVDDTTLQVFLDGETFFRMPNAFSPNNDGLNDVFQPIGYGLESSRSLFQIFNRWGELVYSTRNPFDGWDGTLNGNDAPTGVYVWKLFAPNPYERERDEVKEYMGRVTLVR